MAFAAVEVWIPLVVVVCREGRERREEENRWNKANASFRSTVTALLWLPDSSTMPAAAGRVKMPANNRMQTSASLNTRSIWQNAIGMTVRGAEQRQRVARPLAPLVTGAASAEAASAARGVKALLALLMGTMRVSMTKRARGAPWPWRVQAFSG